MIVTQGKTVVMTDSRLIYVVRLFSEIKATSFLKLSFDDLFNGYFKKENNLESSVHDAMVYTYFNKVGKNQNGWSAMFNLNDKAVSQIIEQHAERSNETGFTYYPRVLRVLDEVEMPKSTGDSLFRKPYAARPFSLRNEHYEKANQILEAITKRVTYSINDIISLSREGMIPCCKILFTHAFFLFYPQASANAVGSLLGIVNHATIRHYQKLHISMMESKTNDTKTKEYRKLYFYLMKELSVVDMFLERKIMKSSA